MIYVLFSVNEAFDSASVVLAFLALVVGFLAGAKGLGVFSWFLALLENTRTRQKHWSNRRRVDQATLALFPKTLTTTPVGAQSNLAKITMTVEDRFRRRLDGAKTFFLTDNGAFLVQGRKQILAELLTSSEGAQADVYKRYNPDQSDFGVAEVTRDSSQATLGLANIWAIIERRGASILLHSHLRIVGPVAATGLVLRLSSANIKLGGTLVVDVSAVDALGQPVADGTVVHLSCESRGAQFYDPRLVEDRTRTEVTTTGGSASTLLTTDSNRAGTYSVTAYIEGFDVNQKLQPIAIVTSHSTSS